MLIEALHMCYLNNFTAAPLVLGAQLLNTHFERIKVITEGVAIAIVYGAAGCRNAASMLVVLSTVETQHTYFIGYCPDITFFQMTTKKTLGITLDDPIDVKTIYEKYHEPF